jgi:hypothetical protein
MRRETEEVLEEEEEEEEEEKKNERGGGGGGGDVEGRKEADNRPERRRICTKKWRRRSYTVRRGLRSRERSVELKVE